MSRATTDDDTRDHQSAATGGERRLRSGSRFAAPSSVQAARAETPPSSLLSSLLGRWSGKSSGEQAAALVELQGKNDELLEEIEELKQKAEEEDEKIQAQEKRIRHRDSQMQKQEGELKELQRRLNAERQKHVEELQKQKASYDLLLTKQKNDHAQQYNSNFSKMKAAYTEKLNSIQHSHESEANKLRERTKQLQDAAHRARETATTQEQQIESLKLARLQSVESPKWAPVSDIDIQTPLKNICAALKQFSEKHATLPLEQFLDPERFIFVAGKLQDLGCINSPNALYNALQANSIMQKPGKAAAMLLCAGLTAFVFRSIVANPFFAFSSEDGDKSRVLRARHQSSLQELVQMLHHADEAGAEAWRCDLMRMLSPSDKRGDEAEAQRLQYAEEVRSSIDINVGVAAREYAIAFGSSAEQAGIQAGLLPIMMQAADLASRVWTRKARIEVACWPVLQSPGQNGNIVFTQDSKDLEYHRYHTNEIREDKAALDGKPVILIDGPAVVRQGNMEGKEYDERVVLKPAMVWMG